MKQIGRVEAVENSSIKISMVRSTACGDSCASCSAGCSLKNQTVSAEYKSGVNVGDYVVFEMPSSKVLFAAFLVYITPLIVLLIAYGISSMCGANESTSAVLSVVCMLVWFVIIHYIDKKLKKYYKHVIVGAAEGDS